MMIEALETRQLLSASLPDFNGGVFVAAGSDAAAGPGGGPVVKALNGVDRRGSATGGGAGTFGIDDPAFRGSARVAVGEVNGDGLDDIIVGTNTSSTHVK